MKFFKIILFVLIFVSGCALLPANNTIKTGQDDFGTYQYEGPFNPIDILSWEMLGYGMSKVQLFCFFKCPHPKIYMVYIMINSLGLIENDPKFERVVQGWCYFLGDQHFSYAWDLEKQCYVRQELSNQELDEMRRFFEEHRFEFEAMEKAKIGARYI